MGILDLLVVILIAVWLGVFTLHLATNLIYFLLIISAIVIAARLLKR